MWHDQLKKANVSIHLIATGAAAGFQEKLWEVPGSSSYLSGASFPYAKEEQINLLGFTPDNFCSEEASLNLAMVAYMKAYRFGGPKPIGIGLTATVASEQAHRGDHRIFCTVITPDQVLTRSHFLSKGEGDFTRRVDGKTADYVGLYTLLDALGIEYDDQKKSSDSKSHLYKDNKQLARNLFFNRPFFSANGQRFHTCPDTNQNFALMPGSFNPLHQGHVGMAETISKLFNRKVLFETTSNPPHKDILSVQNLLQRAKLLTGYDRVFTQQAPFYLDKAKMFPNIPFVMGMDSCLRMLNPGWGIETHDLLSQFYNLGTTFLVAPRMVDGKMMFVEDIKTMGFEPHLSNMFHHLDFQMNISSTELRNQAGMA